MSPEQLRQKKGQLFNVVKTRFELKGKYAYGDCPPDLRETYHDVDKILSGKETALRDEIQQARCAA